MGDVYIYIYDASDGDASGEIVKQRMGDDVEVHRMVQEVWHCVEKFSSRSDRWKE